MEDLKLQEAFLGYLYHCNFDGENPTLDALDDWVTQNRVDRQSFWKQYELLIAGGQIRYQQDRRTVRLTPKGTLDVEKRGLVAPDCIARHRELRKKLVIALKEHLEQSGVNARVRDLALRLGLSDEEVTGDLELLSQMGYIIWRTYLERIDITTKIYQRAHGQSSSA